MLPLSYVTPAAIVLVVTGLVACFAGYRLFRIVLGVYGFVLGAAVASSFMAPSNTWGMIVAALAGGVAGALLMFAAYFTGVGLIGAGLAALLVNAAWRAIGGDPPTLILVVACVLGALGALKAQRWVIVIGTAIAGAWTLIVGGSALLGDATSLRAASAGDVWVIYPLAGGRLHIALWFALALIGAVVQMTIGKKGGRVRARRKTA